MVIEPKSVHSKPVAIAEEFDDDEEDVSVEIMMESDNTIVAERGADNEHLRSAECCYFDAVANRDESISIASNDNNNQIIANPNIFRSPGAFESRM